MLDVTKLGNVLSGIFFLGGFLLEWCHHRYREHNRRREEQFNRKRKEKVDG